MIAAQAHGGAFDEMFQAVRLNDHGQVQELLKRGLDPNLTDPDGNTLLMEAAREGAIEAARLLISHGALLSSQNRYGENALMLAAFKGRDNLVGLMLKRGASPNNSGWNALIYAAMKGHERIVQQLLDHGARVDAASDNGTTALMMASREGHSSIVELLLSYRADPNLINDSGLSALQYARQAQNLELARLLQAAGASR
jgi:hypothetical protein